MKWHFSPISGNRSGGGIGLQRTILYYSPMCKLSEELNPY